ncbi:hypothetical protein HK101_006944 [Irineochytrium annulatum]|nr:hypothetical protein HK101_006944 [Irineochytrium annulatum]
MGKPRLSDAHGLVSLVKKAATWDCHDLSSPNAASLRSPWPRFAEDGAYGLRRKTSKTGYETLEAPHAQPAERRGSTLPSLASIQHLASVPLFLKYYPLLTLCLSICISAPLTWYKWHLAYSDETLLATQSFDGIAINMVDSGWDYATLGAEDEYGYFGYLGKDTLVGLYQLVTKDTLNYWQEWMFNSYGGNMGSTTNFTIFNKYPNGTKYPAVPDPYLYMVHMTSKDKLPGNWNALGFNGWSETAIRRPLIQKVATTGNVSVSPRVTLANSATPMSGILVMAGLYLNATTGSLQRGLTDVMPAISFSAVTCPQVVHNALVNTVVPAGVHAFLFDQDGASTSQFLAHYATTTHPIFDNFTLASVMTQDAILGSVSADLTHTADFTVLSRNWRVVIVAETGYINAHRTSFPNILIVIALIEPAIGLIIHGAVMIVRLNHETLPTSPHTQMEPFLKESRRDDGALVCGICLDDHATDACPNLQDCRDFVRGRGATGIQRKPSKAGYESLTTPQAQPAERRRSTLPSLASVQQLTSVPLFLKYYPLLTLCLSMCISAPLVWYKWHLAYSDETLLATQTFNGIALNMIESVRTGWEYAALGAEVMADVAVTLNGTLTEPLYEGFSDESGYFGYLGKNTIVALYQLVTKDTLDYWQNWMFNTYGGNMGSTTNFTIFNKFPNGTKYPAVPDPYIYMVALSSKDKVPANINALDGATTAQFLAHYATTTHPVFDNFTLTSVMTQDAILSSLSADLTHTADFTMLNRNWRVVVVAEAGYINAQRTSFPNILIVIALVEPAVGLIIHGVVMIVRLANPRHAHIEHKH